MLKNFMKLIFFISSVFMNDVIASSTNSSINDSYNLTVQLGNLTFSPGINIPRHNFFYEMTIPISEISKGAPLTGSLPYDSSDISTVFYRLDYDNIEVNLNVSDPAMGKRVIWKGKIILNKVFNKVNSVPEFVDDMHYMIYINIIQPDQGRSQFIMSIVSL